MATLKKQKQNNERKKEESIINPSVKKGGRIFTSGGASFAVPLLTLVACSTDELKLENLQQEMGKSK